MPKREPRSNLFFACSAHSARPDPRLAQRDSASFVGCYVKRAFISRTGAQIEHMWVLVERVTPDGVLEGRLNNNPHYDVGVVCGDTVLVSLNMIEAVLEG